MRVYYKPFVDWIWGGALVMALGGLLAATDRRYRRRGAEAVAPAPVASPPTPRPHPAGALGREAS